MTVRSTTATLRYKVRQMIQDISGANQFFSEQDLQDYLDQYRDDIRYEPLDIAPSIVNTASTNNQASTIFADYYSAFNFWEDDIVLQGYSNGAAWVVLTPVLSENLLGHWSFETSVFTSGTIPGQFPPVFATGKIFDPYASSADLLEFWGAASAASYDITVEGQSLRRSQLMTAKFALAEVYRRRAKPRVGKIVRTDVLPTIDTVRARLLDRNDVLR